MIKQRLPKSTLLFFGLWVLVLSIMTPTGAGAADRFFAWEVCSETATITMFGSIHLGRADFYPLPQGIEKAFEVAPAIAVEVDILNPDGMGEISRLMLQKGMLQDGETLDDILPPELKTKVLAALGENEGMWPVFKKFTPGLLAMTLSMQELQRIGFDESLGLEKHFLDAARGHKEIRELETIEQQMALFFDLDEKLQFAFLESTVDQLSGMGAILDQLVVAWKAGDPEALDELMLSQVGDDPDLLAFYKLLLDDRNVGMANKIDGYLQGDTDVFVLAGAAHFPGKMGIVKLLADKGWVVTQLTK